MALYMNDYEWLPALPLFVGEKLIVRHLSFLPTILYDLMTYIKAYARTVKYCLGRLMVLIPRPRSMFHNLINRPLDGVIYNRLMPEFYGNRYLELYEDSQREMPLERGHVSLVCQFLPDTRTVCDAGCNRGYHGYLPMEALVEQISTDAFGEGHITFKPTS